EAASGLASEVQVSTAGLKRLALFAVTAPLVLLVGLSAVGVMAVPIHGGSTALGGPYIDAPVLGIVSAFHPSWLMHTLRYVIGGVGALVLLQAVNGTMLGLSRLTYSLATNRQVPSLLGRLHATRSTPYVAISVAAIVATGLAYSADLEFLTGIFAFGATLAFTIAHLSVIVMRNRERDARRAFRIPLAVTGRGWEVPLSVPLDARVPEEEIAAAKKAVARAKEVGEEYEGVTVATAMVRARAAGEAIVTEAKRRGVEAIVLAAEKPTRMRGGKILGG